MDIRKQVEFLKTLSREDLKRYKAVSKYLSEIQIDADIYEINKMMLDDVKRIWVINDVENMEKFKLSLSKNPKEDIIKLFKKNFNSDISKYEFHFLLTSNIEAVKKLNKNIESVPFLFETYNNEIHNTISIDLNS